MTDLTAATIWTLITVTNAGNVHQESGFQSKALCEDAISIAKTGLTVSEVTDRDNRAKEEARRKREEWSATHPARQPISAKEKEDINSRRTSDGTCTPIMDVSSHISITKDCLIQENDHTLPYGLSSAVVYPGNQNNEIKYARCVLTVPEAKQ